MGVDWVNQMGTTEAAVLLAEGERAEESAENRTVPDLSVVVNVSNVIDTERLFDDFYRWLGRRLQEEINSSAEGYYPHR